MKPSDQYLHCFHSGNLLGQNKGLLITSITDNHIAHYSFKLYVRTIFLICMYVCKWHKVLIEMYYASATLKTYAAISNAHLFRVCKRGKLSGSCLSTLNGFGSIQLPIFLCHIGVPTFSSQNNSLKCV